MKKLNILFACLFIAFAQLPAQSPEQPQLALGFPWDDSLQTWGDTIFRHTHSYQGNLETPASTLQEVKVSGNWQNQYRTNRQWNVDGLLTEEFTESWENGQWEPSSKKILTYNGQGHVLTGIYLADVAYGYDTSGIEFYSNTYDGAGNLTEVHLEAKYYGDPSFTPQWREFRTYSSNNEMTSREHQIWSNQSWKTSWKMRGVQWRDYSKEQLSEYKMDYYTLSPTPEDSAWYVYDWGANDSYTEYILSFDPLAFAWDSAAKRVRTFDAYAHQEVRERYFLDDSLNVWELEEGERRTNFLNTDGFLSAYESERFGFWSTAYERDIRWEFYQFNVGVEEALPVASFHCFWGPHPVSDLGTLHVESEKPGRLQVELLDIQGKSLKRFEMHQGQGSQEHRLDIGLPAGLYLYRIQLLGKLHAGSLVLKH